MGRTVELIGDGQFVGCGPLCIQRHHILIGQCGKQVGLVAAQIVVHDGERIACSMRQRSIEGLAQFESKASACGWSDQIWEILDAQARKHVLRDFGELCRRQAMKFVHEGAAHQEQELFVIGARPGGGALGVAAHERFHILGRHRLLIFLVPRLGRRPSGCLAITGAVTATTPCASGPPSSASCAGSLRAGGKIWREIRIAQPEAAKRPPGVGRPVELSARLAMSGRIEGEHIIEGERSDFGVFDRQDAIVANIAARRARLALIHQFDQQMRRAMQCSSPGATWSQPSAISSCGATRGHAASA